MKSFKIKVEFEGDVHEFLVVKYLNEAENRVDYGIYGEGTLIYDLYLDYDDFGDLWRSYQQSRQGLIDAIGEKIDRHEM